MSRYAVEGLQVRGVPLGGALRHPLRLTRADLAGADLVIALKEAEHRAMLAEQFPLWADRVEYWHVDDLDCAQPEEALPAIEEMIHDLVRRLRAME